MLVGTEWPSDVSLSFRFLCAPSATSASSKLWFTMNHMVDVPWAKYPAHLRSQLERLHYWPADTVPLDLTVDLEDGQNVTIVDAVRQGMMRKRIKTSS